MGVEWIHLHKFMQNKDIGKIFDLSSPPTSFHPPLVFPLLFPLWNPSLVSNSSVELPPSHILYNWNIIILLYLQKKVWIGKTKAHVIKGVVTFWRILVSQLFFNFYYVNLASLRYVIVDYAVIWCLFVKVVPSMYVCLFIRKLAYLCPFFRWIFIL